MEKETERDIEWETEREMGGKQRVKQDGKWEEN